MRCMLAIATRAPIGRAQLSATTGADRGGAKGAVSYRARAVTPSSDHWLALQVAFARAHDGSARPAPIPLRLLEATHQRVLWALATFALADGTVVAERFSWRRGVGWRDLGSTSSHCPAVPPEVRGAWRLGDCR
jgi:hypothetical protein